MFCPSNSTIQMFNFFLKGVLQMLSILLSRPDYRATVRNGKLLNRNHNFNAPPPKKNHLAQACFIYMAVLNRKMISCKMTKFDNPFLQEITIQSNLTSSFKNFCRTCILTDRQTQINSLFFLFPLSHVCECCNNERLCVHVQPN